MMCKIINKNNEVDVASMVMQFVTRLKMIFSKDCIFISNNNYLKFSVNNSNAEDGVVASMVMHSPDERDLLQRRLPGSNPGRTASAVFVKLFSLFLWMYLLYISKYVRNLRYTIAKSSNYVMSRTLSNFLVLEHVQDAKEAIMHLDIKQNVGLGVDGLGLGDYAGIGVFGKVLQDNVINLIDSVAQNKVGLHNIEMIVGLGLSDKVISGRLVNMLDVNWLSLQEAVL